MQKLLFVSIAIIILAATGSCKKENSNQPSVFSCGTSTITDIDGNVYNTVKIGTQCWMKENLKTAHFRDGTAIQEIEDTMTWANFLWLGWRIPAWCYYHSDSTNNANYGKLYSWYTVMDSNVCPTGWHVPDDSEWIVLTNYLGDTGIAGEHMKAISLWQPPNIGADNSSGFTALPGGYRSLYGNDVYLGTITGFWSITPANIFTEAHIHILRDSLTDCLSDNSEKGCGFSIRCIEN